MFLLEFLVITLLVLIIKFTVDYIELFVILKLFFIVFLLDIYLLKSFIFVIFPILIINYIEISKNLQINDFFNILKIRMVWICNFISDYIKWLIFNLLELSALFLNKKILIVLFLQDIILMTIKRFYTYCFFLLIDLVLFWISVSIQKSIKFSLFL